MHTVVRRKGVQLRKVQTTLVGHVTNPCTEVREALKALKAEGEATASAAAAAAAAAAGPPPAADEGDAPSTAALSLASAASGCRRIWTKNGRSTQSSSSSTTAAHGLLCRSFQHNELAERMALPKPIVQHSSS